MSVVAALILCTTVTVHDGDTIRCNGERVRIANIDAPELPDSPKCHHRRASYGWCDYAAGARSRDALARLVETGPVRIERQGVDKYGRTLTRVTVNGRDAGDYLIGLGLARRWQ